MNYKLASKSESCAQQVASLLQAEEKFANDYMSPFEITMKFAVNLEDSIANELPNCAKEFRRGKDLRERSMEALKQSRSTIAKSKDDTERFMKLEATAADFASQSRLAAEHCGTQPDPSWPVGSRARSRLSP